MAGIATGRSEYTYRYDFAVQGGAVGAKVLTGPVLPSGVAVVDALLVVDTVLAGHGHGHAEPRQRGDGRTCRPPRHATPPRGQTGIKRVTLTATSAPVRTTVDRVPVLNINATALTSGRFRLILTVVEVV